uniref:Uncharacterized protein n=1 Tax=Strombidium rassoulzadegani TaxID=1082188 RepID=A0A7S3CPM4_9SPIT|mmetsp:Transcript_2337/g.4005  ORF Transcript_2337/g.4005 Transcript_2337/m.4005 type:complete len:175 (+) Transcript_2337:447-971(+)
MKQKQLQQSSWLSLLNSSIFTFGSDPAAGKNFSIEVDFLGQGDEQDPQQSIAKKQASRIKAFVMYRCGHRFHKKCISEKLLIEKEKRDLLSRDAQSARLEQGEEPTRAGELDDDFDYIQPFLVPPRYMPLSNFDRKRDRRLETLRERIKKSDVKRKLLEQKYQKCIFCFKLDVI